jgi:2-keto-4-pentenoate hydratase/2-oxohepta-3-ene-1,7-dioic acid hydratase in catechol pathway
MKLLSFVADGKECFGALSGDGVITLNDKIGQPNLRAALAAGAMAAMRTAAAEHKPDRKRSDIKFLPVIPQPAKILCAGINYRSHAAETGRELPKQPSMFIRFTDTLVGHDGSMIRPTVSDNFDFEGELAAVIGKGGRHIRPETALEHVAGYTCFVDGSVRDFQKFSVTSGKNFPGTGPLGPWLVTTDEIRDPQQLAVLRVAAPMQSSDARLELLHRKRLDDIVICAAVQTLDAIRYRVFRGEHQDGS